MLSNHSAFGLLGVVARVQSFAPIFERVAGTLELARPDELERKDRRRLAVTVLRQRPFERERLLHLLARDASPAAEVEEPIDRQRPAPEHGVPGT